MDNPEFKPIVLHLKIDLVPYPTYGRGIEQIHISYKLPGCAHIFIQILKLK